MRVPIENLIYIVIVACFVAVTKTANASARSIKDYFKSSLESVFVAYVTFEISFYYLDNFRLCLALAAIGAWFGTATLEDLKELLIDLFKRKTS